MAWIEAHQEIIRHPKTKRLSRALDTSIPTTIGHLFCLWFWCLDYAQDGNLSKHDEYEIADAAMWEGDPREFLLALVESGFVEMSFGDAPEYSIHDWMRYGGRLLLLRQANAAKQKKFREDQAKKSGRDKTNLRMA